MRTLKVATLVLAVVLLALIAASLDRQPGAPAGAVGRGPAESRILCDFESAEDLALWRPESADLTLTDGTGVTSGLGAAEVEFRPSNGASGLLLKGLFRRDRSAADWSGYESLRLDVHNPGQARQLIFKVRDAAGKSHTSKLPIEPGRGAGLSLYIAELRPAIDVRSVRQLQIYLWTPSRPTTLILDNLRLVPSSGPGEEATILGAAAVPGPGEPVYGVPYHDFAAKRSGWLRSGSSSVRVPLYVNNPGRLTVGPVPVTGGIPFPRGELASANSVRLVDESGTRLPAQFRPLGRWTDGSIKWLRADTVLSMSGGERQRCFLEYGGNGADRPVEGRLAVREGPTGITVDTGPLKFHVGRKGFRLFDQVWIDGNRDGGFSEDERISSGSDLVVNFRGEEYRSSLDEESTLVLEEQGPVKVVLRAEGWFVSAKGKRFSRFIVRVHAFAGQDHLKVFHTFVYTGYPENRHHFLYRDKRLPANEPPEAILIETAISLSEGAVYSYGADGGRSVAPSPDPQLFQKTSASFVVRSNERETAKGSRLDGWFNASDSKRGVTVALRKPWQQHPKAWGIVGGGRKLVVALWPLEAGPLDLSTTAAAGGDSAAARGSAFGLAKTHEMSWRFHRGALDDRGSVLASWLGGTALLSASPEWVADSLAIGKVRARRNGVMKPAERGTEALFDWAARQIRDHEWYGMIDFGDTRTWYREKDGRRGWFPDGRWGWLNNEAMGLHAGALVQYLRTGEQKYLEFGEDSVRHVMDVDTVHYDTVANDERLRRMIPGDFSQVGSQHRHNADHWGGRNEETSHTNLHGILLYYYMTGSERALEVAREIGEFFLKERVAYIGHPDKCPQRNIANLLWGAAELHELDGDPRYRELADRWADVLHRGQLDNGTWPEEYNPLSRRWAGKPKDLFTTQYTLPALVAYHRVTGNKAIAACIVKATDHYIEKKPYNPFFEALAYSYYLTGERRYLNAADENLRFFLGKQMRGKDPLENGMIFSKLSYLRAVEFLYQFPFAFDGVQELDRTRSRPAP